MHDISWKKEELQFNDKTSGARYTLARVYDERVKTFEGLQREQEEGSRMEGDIQSPYITPC